jgi:hypothetical protein
MPGFAGAHPLVISTMAQAPSVNSLRDIVPLYNEQGVLVLLIIGV